MSRRCFACGVGHEQGEVVRRCDSCAFDYCLEHAATVGGVTKCEECKRIDEKEAAMRTAPLHDGTADTAEFDCGACGNRHPRFLPDDDGIVGGQGRTASSLRDGYVVAMVVFAAISLGVGLGVWLACR